MVDVSHVSAVRPPCCRRPAACRLACAPSLLPCVPLSTQLGC
jgi:hypothetical protein